MGLINGPFLNFIRAIPPAAIVPIVMVAMGTGPAPKVFIIAFACIWPILLNTVDGVRGMNPQLIWPVFGPNCALTPAHNLSLSPREATFSIAMQR